MAAGGNPDNIQLGPGRLYYAPIGTAEPTNASSALDAAYKVIGYTEDGSEVQIGLTSESIMVSEELDAVDEVLTERLTMVSLEMAEVTRRRLALVLGLGASASDSAATLEPPTAGAEESFMLVWDSEEDAVGNADNIRWLFRKCKVTGNINIARRKAPNKATLPVEIKCSKPAGAEAFTVFPNADGLV